MTDFILLNKCFTTIELPPAAASPSMLPKPEQATFPYALKYAHHMVSSNNKP